MSKFTVNLEDEPKSAPRRAAPSPASAGAPTKKKRGCLKFLGIFAGVLAVIAVIAAVGGYFYWRSMTKTPQYSLALLIDAARTNDQKTIDQIVDTNAVVDDFMPQITDKAVEIYGRNLPPQTLSKVAQVAAPLLPAIKERAKAELPRVIREKTDKFASVPFAAIVLGADRYLDIAQQGDAAVITSKLADRPLEVKMRRNGDKWQVIGVKDEQLATRIAQKVGQEIVAAATKGGLRKAGESLGVQNLQELLKKTEDIFK